MNLVQQSSLARPDAAPAGRAGASRFLSQQRALAKTTRKAARTAAEKNLTTLGGNPNHPGRDEIPHLGIGKTRFPENRFARLTDKRRRPVGLCLHARHPERRADSRQRAFAW